MLQRRSATFILFSIGADVLLTLATLALATQMRDVIPAGAFIPIPVELPSAVYPLTLAIWFFTFLVFSVYDPRRSQHILDEVRRVLGACLFSALTLAGALYFSFRDVPRLLVMYFIALNVTALLGWRIVGHAIRLLLRRGPLSPSRRVLIIGATPLGQQVAAMIEAHAWTGLEFVGYLDAEDGDRVLGPLNAAQAVCHDQGIHEVIITLPYRDYDKLNDLIAGLQRLPLQVRIAPDYLSLALHHATVEVFSGMPLINLRDPALSGYQRLVKRAFDLALGGVLLIALLPVMLLIALLIRLDSPGSPLFRQKRVGENGRLFTMFKFRSMYCDAQADPETMHLDAAGRIIYKIENDSRATRIGRFLRRTSLDELPQLINVLRGEMSLVGPRPEMPWLVDRYELWQLRRFAVPQGMTGWWQVNGRSDRPMHLHTEDDLYYIQNYSIWLDIVILWRTVFAVVARRGAY